MAAEAGVTQNAVLRIWHAFGLQPHRLPKRITPQMFRRTLITLCFQAGKDIVFVQSQAGHADWKTTLAIYTQVRHRSVDPEIRELLDIFLGMPETGEIAGPTAARERLDAPLQILV